MDERFSVYGTAREPTGGRYPSGIGECHSLSLLYGGSNDDGCLGRSAVGGPAVEVASNLLSDAADDDQAADDEIPAEVGGDGEEPANIEQVGAPPTAAQDEEDLEPVESPEHEAEEIDPQPSSTVVIASEVDAQLGVAQGAEAPGPVAPSTSEGLPCNREVEDGGFCDTDPNEDVMPATTAQSSQRTHSATSDHPQRDCTITESEDRRLSGAELREDSTLPPTEGNGDVGHSAAPSLHQGSNIEGNDQPLATTEPHVESAPVATTKRARVPEVSERPTRRQPQRLVKTSAARKAAIETRSRAVATGSRTGRQARKEQQTGDKGMFPLGPSDCNKPKTNITNAADAANVPKGTFMTKWSTRLQHTMEDVEREESVEALVNARARKATTKADGVKGKTTEATGVSGVERADMEENGHIDASAGGRTVKGRKTTKRSRDDDSDDGDAHIEHPQTSRRKKAARRK